MKKYVGIFLVLVLSASGARAATIDFNCITNNSGNCGGVAPLVTLDVNQLGTDDTWFRLSVADGVNAAVKSIFFEDPNNLLDPTDYEFDFSGGKASAGGVEFDPFQEAGKGKDKGGNLPGGNEVSFSSDFSTEATPSGDGKDGIDNGEWFGITFFNTESSWILSALGTGDLRIGIQVGSVGLDGEFSESLVTTIVPIPAAAWLFGSALIGFIGLSRIRRKTAQAA